MTTPKQPKNPAPAQPEAPEGFYTGVLTPTGYYKQESYWPCDLLFFSCRWESDLFTGRLLLDPETNKESLEIETELEDLTLEEARALVEELTSWLERVEAGERWANWQGFDMNTRVHQSTSEGLSVCGLPLALGRAGAPRPPGMRPCPNCLEIVSDERTKAEADRLRAEGAGV